MSAPPDVLPTSHHRRIAWLTWSNPVVRAPVRWVLIAALTLFAFHDSLVNLYQTLVAGGLNGYIFLLPVAGIDAAQGIARRKRNQLPIHDRQTDIIVAVMGLVLALLFDGVLLHRYAMYFHLLRIDLVAMWMFVISCAVALFGLRPVMRFGWVWALLLMVFPLPYHIMVILLGGTNFAAGAVTLLIAGTATGISTGRWVSRGVLGSLTAYVVGLSLLAIMAWIAPPFDVPLWAYQFIPATLSMVLSGIGIYLASRRGAPKTLLDRKIEPLATRQAWAVVPLVVGVAVALSLVRLPDLDLAPAARVDTLTFDAPPPAPPGWHVVRTVEFSWVKRIFGPNALLTRQIMVADTGDPRYDKFARPRTLVVDSTVTDNPFRFDAYPAPLTYHLEKIRMSDPRPVDLGFGVDGDLVSVIDDKILVTWDGLQWTWTNGSRAERVVVIAVDNHEDWAPFPQPVGALIPTLNAMFTTLIRGNSVTRNVEPVVKDDGLLNEFGRGMVRARLEPLGARP